MRILNEYGSLCDAEKKFVLRHPVAAFYFWSNARKALRTAGDLFRRGCLYNGSGDAFIHCYWCAMNCRDRGRMLAEAFGNAHEDWQDNPQEEKTMDLYNNEVGYRIGTHHAGASDRQLAERCLAAWSAGELMQIDDRRPGDFIGEHHTAPSLGCVTRR